MKGSVGKVGILVLIVLTGAGTITIQKIKGELGFTHAFAEIPENKPAAGIDKDQNGIRDEIDLLIMREYNESPGQNRAAQVLARNLQTTAQTRSLTKLRAIELGNRASDAIDCLMSHTSEESAASVTRDLINATLNTQERRKNDSNFSRLVSGQKYNARGREGCR